MKECGSLQLTQYVPNFTRTQMPHSIYIRDTRIIYHKLKQNAKYLRSHHTVQKFSFHILCGYMNYFMKIRFLHSYQFRTEDFLFMFESTESNIELSTVCDECDIDVIRTSFGVFRIFIGVQHLHFVYILNWTVHSIPLFWYQLQLQCGQLTRIGRLMIQMSKVL